MKPEKKTYEQLRNEAVDKCLSFMKQTYEREEIDYTDSEISHTFYGFNEGSNWALTLPLSVLAEKNEGVRGLVEALKKQSEFISGVYTSKGLRECHYTRYYEIRYICKEALQQLENEK